MDKENLNNKIWFRAVKVFFVFLFILVQLSAAFLVTAVANEKQIDPTSYNDAGSIVKQKISEYADYSNEEVGRKLFGNNKTLSFEQFKTLKDRGFTLEQIANLVKYKNKYNIVEKIGFYIATFVIITLIFYLISRIFFYIILGEKFFKFK